MEPIEKIRRYQSSDKQSCMDSFISNVPKFFTEQEILDFDFFLNTIEKNETLTQYYVLTFNEKVIGCGGFGNNNNNEIVTLAWGLIHSNYHKKGFGKKLLVHRLNQIKKSKFNQTIQIDTSQYTYDFFEKYGFQVTKITNDFYAKGLHRYDMQLKL